jgi:H/ACA ribonucleoprotein complex subunit 4
MKIDLKKLKQSKTTKELLEFGIINIDKCRGPTSFNVSEYVCKRLNARKTSHLGTLDPQVTGVLPVAINRACKLTGYFLGENKTYIGIMRLHKEVGLKEIQEKINEKFIGKITQMPPLKSAVKRQERVREIYEFEVLEKENLDALFRVKCEGGTYVRTLCVDLGEELGVGAHMLELRRTQAGIFPEENIISLYDFEKAVEEYENGKEEKLREMIIPGEIVSILHDPIEIKKSSVDKIFHGSPIHDDEVEDKKVLEHKVGKILSVFSEGKFIGIFKVIKEGNLFARSEFTLQPLK